MTAPNEHGVIERPQIVLELPRREPETWQGGPWASICLHPASDGTWLWAGGHDFKLQGGSCGLHDGLNGAPTKLEALKLAKAKMIEDIAHISGPDAKYARKVRQWMKTLALPEETPAITPTKPPMKGKIMAKTPKTTQQFMKVTIVGYIPFPDFMGPDPMGAVKRFDNSRKQIDAAALENMQDVTITAKQQGRLVETPPAKPIRDPKANEPLTVAPTETAGEIAEDEGEDIEAKPVTLLGSNVQPSAWHTEEGEVKLAFVVGLAQENSPFDAEKWNSITQETREKWIAEQIEKMSLKPKDAEGYVAPGESGGS